MVSRRFHCRRRYGNELDLSVNELLTGERISETEYREKAEENMVNLVKEAQESKKKIIYSPEWYRRRDYCSYANVCGSGSISDGGLDADCADCSRHSCHCDRHCDCIALLIVMQEL